MTCPSMLTWNDRRGLRPRSFLVASLRTAADDLDFVGLDSLCPVVHFEGDVLDEECPDFVAEPIGVKRSLAEESQSAQPS